MCQQANAGKFDDRKLLVDFDSKKPLFELEEEQKVNTHQWLRFSSLSGYRAGVEPIHGTANFSSIQDEKQGTNRVFMYNLSLEEMLTHGFFKPSLVVLEVKDPSKYRYNHSDGNKEDWLRKNGHCYELLLPYGVFKEARTFEDDLNQLIGVKTSKEKRLTDVLVLVRTSDKDKIRSKDNGPQGYDGKSHFNNVGLDYLGSLLEESGLPLMIDETGYHDPVDLDLNVKSWGDFGKVREALQRYDLDLRKEKREVTMFVITEIK